MASACLLSAVSLVPVSSYAQDKDIVDTAIAAEDFTILAKALQAADLVDTLKADGPYTVFAPTDEAFKRLPKGTIESLLKPENKDQLINILTYHVVKGKVDGSTAVTLKVANALNNEKIKLSFNNAALFVNKARVIKTDIPASNGVIHVIDNVIMPASDARVMAAKAKAKAADRGIKSKGGSAKVAISIIEESIDMGVDLFNAGNKRACASIYKIAAMSVVEINPVTLDKSDIASLETALKTVANSENHKENAWTLRNAIDKAYRSLKN